MCTETEKCRICGNAELEPVINLGIQALTGIFPRTRDQHVPVGPLELVKCKDRPGACGLVQLRNSSDPALMYGANYGYRSGLNPSMVRHLGGIAESVHQNIGLSAGDLVLDIGSNDGTLLRALSVPGITMVGMDPTADKFRAYYPEECVVIADLFSSDRFRREFGSRKARSITSIAMFYDLDAPTQFVREIAEVLAQDGLWTFEQSYLPFMVEKDSYDTICHEHLEYYGLRQILFMTEQCGLTIVDVTFNDSNGGSFRVTVGHASAYPSSGAAVYAALQRELGGGYDRPEVYGDFRNRVERRRDELKLFLRDCRRDGRRILGYGASTKGNVILQYSGITADDLPLIAEVNSDKFGSFTPGTLIPIISEKEARSLKPDSFLVLPWHFRDFIVQKEHDFLSSGGSLIFPLPALDSISLTPMADVAPVAAAGKEF